MKNIKKYVVEFGRFVWHVVDFIDIMFYGGVVLVGIGASHVGAGYGPLLAGVLLVFSARPLSKWWKG